MSKRDSSHHDRNILLVSDHGIHPRQSYSPRSYNPWVSMERVGTRLSAPPKGEKFASLLGRPEEFLQASMRMRPRFFAVGKVFHVVPISQTPSPSERRPPPRHTRTSEPTVECTVHGNSMHAIPDTGADSNYISEAEVQRRNYVVNHKESRKVKMANGRWVKTLGTVRLRFGFRYELQRHHLKFHVVKECIQDMILGSWFHWATKTLTKFRNRITEVVRKTTASCVRFMGSPQLRGRKVPRALR